MNLGKMLGEDLEGLALGDYAMRPQIMSDELVDLDNQPPPGAEGVAGLGVVYPQTYGGYGYNQQPYNLGSPYRYGTKNWWQWYATTYLPQYYNQQQIYQMLQQHPLYSTFGYPSGIYNQYQYNQYPYNQGAYNQYQYNQYPYQGYNQYGYPPGYGQYVYGQQGAYGAQQCAAQGGYFDYAQQQCYPQYGTTGYGQTGTPPNVIGQSVSQGVSSLNAAGFTVWERLRDGSNQGNPPSTTASNRVVIDDNNGVISAAYVG